MLCATADGAAVWAAVLDPRQLHAHDLPQEDAFAAYDDADDAALCVAGWGRMRTNVAFHSCCLCFQLVPRSSPRCPSPFTQTHTHTAWRRVADWALGNACGGDGEWWVRLILPMVCTASQQPQSQTNPRTTEQAQERLSWYQDPRLREHWKTVAAALFLLLSGLGELALRDVAEAMSNR